MTGSIFALLHLLIFIVMVTGVDGRGVLSIKLSEFHNPSGRTFSGVCCDAGRGTDDVFTKCANGCDYVMRIIVSGLGRSNDHVFLFHRPLKYNSNDVIFPHQDYNMVLTVLFDQWPSNDRVKMSAFFYDYDDWDHTTTLVDWFVTDLRNSSVGDSAWDHNRKVQHSQTVVGKRRHNKTKLTFEWAVTCNEGENCHQSLSSKRQTFSRTPPLFEEFEQVHIGNHPYYNNRGFKHFETTKFTPVKSRTGETNSAMYPRSNHHNYIGDNRFTSSGKKDDPLDFKRVTKNKSGRIFSGNVNEFKSPSLTVEQNKPLKLVSDHDAKQQVNGEIVQSKYRVLDLKKVNKFSPNKPPISAAAAGSPPPYVYLGISGKFGEKARSSHNQQFRHDHLESIKNGSKIKGHSRSRNSHIYNLHNKRDSKQRLREYHTPTDGVKSSKKDEHRVERPFINNNKVLNIGDHIKNGDKIRHVDSKSKTIIWNRDYEIEYRTTNQSTNQKSKLVGVHQKKIELENSTSTRNKQKSKNNYPPMLTPVSTNVSQRSATTQSTQSIYRQSRTYKFYFDDKTSKNVIKSVTKQQHDKHISGKQVSSEVQNLPHRAWSQTDSKPSYTNKVQKGSRNKHIFPKTISSSKPDEIRETKSTARVASDLEATKTLVKENNPTLTKDVLKQTIVLEQQSVLYSNGANIQPVKKSALQPSVNVYSPKPTNLDKTNLTLQPPVKVYSPKPTNLDKTNLTLQPNVNAYSPKPTNLDKTNLTLQPLVNVYSPKPTNLDKTNLTLQPPVKVYSPKPTNLDKTNLTLQPLVNVYSPKPTNLDKTNLTLQPNVNVYSPKPTNLDKTNLKRKGQPYYSRWQRIQKSLNPGTPPEGGTRSAVIVNTMRHSNTKSRGHNLTYIGRHQDTITYHDRLSYPANIARKTQQRVMPNNASKPTIRRVHRPNNIKLLYKSIKKLKAVKFLTQAPVEWVVTGHAAFKQKGKSNEMPTASVYLPLYTTTSKMAPSELDHNSNSRGLYDAISTPNINLQDRITGNDFRTPSAGHLQDKLTSTQMLNLFTSTTPTFTIMDRFTKSVNHERTKAISREKGHENLLQAVTIGNNGKPKERTSGKYDLSKRADAFLELNNTTAKFTHDHHIPTTTKRMSKYMQDSGNDILKEKDMPHQLGTISKNDRQTDLKLNSVNLRHTTSVYDRVKEVVSRNLSLFPGNRDDKNRYEKTKIPRKHPQKTSVQIDLFYDKQRITPPLIHEGLSKMSDNSIAKREKSDPLGYHGSFKKNVKGSLAHHNKTFPTIVPYSSEQKESEKRYKEVSSIQREHLIKDVSHQVSASNQITRAASVNKYSKRQIITSMNAKHPNNSNYMVNTSKDNSLDKMSRATKIRIGTEFAVLSPQRNETITHSYPNENNTGVTGQEHEPRRQMFDRVEDKTIVTFDTTVGNNGLDPISGSYPGSRTHLNKYGTQRLNGAKNEITRAASVDKYSYETIMPSINTKKTVTGYKMNGSKDDTMSERVIQTTLRRGSEYSAVSPPSDDTLNHSQQNDKTGRAKGNETRHLVLDRVEDKTIVKETVGDGDFDRIKSYNQSVLENDTAIIESSKVMMNERGRSIVPKKEPQSFKGQIPKSVGINNHGSRRLDSNVQANRKNHTKTSSKSKNGTDMKKELSEERNGKSDHQRGSHSNLLQQIYSTTGNLSPEGTNKSVDRIKSININGEDIQSNIGPTRRFTDEIKESVYDSHEMSHEKLVQNLQGLSNQRSTKQIKYFKPAIKPIQTSTRSLYPGSTTFRKKLSENFENGYSKTTTILSRIKQKSNIDSSPHALTPTDDSKEYSVKILNTTSKDNLTDTKHFYTTRLFDAINSLLDKISIIKARTKQWSSLGLTKHISKSNVSNEISNSTFLTQNLTETFSDQEASNSSHRDGEFVKVFVKSSNDTKVVQNFQLTSFVDKETNRNVSLIDTDSETATGNHSFIPHFPSFSTTQKISRSNITKVGEFSRKNITPNYHVSKEGKFWTTKIAFVNYTTKEERFSTNKTAPNNTQEEQWLTSRIATNSNITKNEQYSTNDNTQSDSVLEEGQFSTTQIGESLSTPIKENEHNRDRIPSSQKTTESDLHVASSIDNMHNTTQWKLPTPLLQTDKSYLTTQKQHTSQRVVSSNHKMDYPLKTIPVNPKLFRPKTSPYTTKISRDFHPVTFLMKTLPDEGFKLHTQKPHTKTNRISDDTKRTSIILPDPKLRKSKLSAHVPNMLPGEIDINKLRKYLFEIRHAPTVNIPAKGLFEEETTSEPKVDLQSTDFSSHHPARQASKHRVMDLKTIFKSYWPAVFGILVGTLFLLTALGTSLICRQRRLLIQRNRWTDSPQHLSEPPDTSEYATSSVASLNSDFARS